MLVAWFRDEHGILISRNELRYRMLKMGFVFDKLIKEVLFEAGF